MLFACMNGGRWQEAMQVAVEHWPLLRADGRLCGILMQILARHRQWAVALNVVPQMTAPTPRTTHFLLEVCRRVRKIDFAVEYYKRSPKEAWDDGTLAAVAERFVDRGQWAEALRCLQACLLPGGVAATPHAKVVTVGMLAAWVGQQWYYAQQFALYADQHGVLLTRDCACRYLQICATAGIPIRDEELALGLRDAYHATASRRARKR